MDREEIEGLSLEDTFSKIDEVMDKLASSDVPLEESFGLYKNGMELLAHCSKVIDGVEKQVRVLSGDGEEKELEELNNGF